MQRIVLSVGSGVILMMLLIELYDAADMMLIESELIMSSCVCQLSADEQVYRYLQFNLGP